MYTDWFKLKKLPFRLRPDPEFLFQDSEAGPVLEALRAAVASAHGTLCLIGESGTGKTTLLHALAREHQGAMPVARVQQPSLTAEELLDALCEQFGLAPSAGEEPGPAARIMRFVAEEAGHRRSVLVLVDEAHRASGAMLRALVDLGARPQAPLIVLAGEPELSKTLAALAALGQPAGLLGTLRLPRLNQAQVAGYLDYRLGVAGSNGRALFEPDTLLEIMRYTGGTPQLINMLCDSAMSYAESHSTQRVGIPEIRDAVLELKWVEFTARAAQPGQATDPASSGSVRALRPAVRPELEVLHSGRPLSRLALKPGRIIVGRGEDAGLRLESQFVSRQHCQLITTAEQTFVEDLGSTNGILVNGRRRRMHRLVPDDRIVIGDHTLIYHEIPQPQPG
ncbi:MAG: AAA family ATPase [Gammaproteobacteria bacterium]|nr:AAA family ATPase [Gammaproteobacteria bacterium]MDE2251477.1 AAA family ATPase [Gammaproteobacteria bacterium]